MIKVIGNNKLSNYLKLYLPALGFELDNKKPEVMIDATNDPETKKKTYNQKAALMISASAASGSCSFVAIRNNKLDNLLNKAGVEDFILKDYAGREQGSCTSGLIAALVADEIVKYYDCEASIRRLSYSIALGKRFCYSINVAEKKGTKEIKALVAGLGGIGSYVALNLVLLGAREIEMYDGDVIEEHNISRQIFYSGSVGKKKATVLPEKLQQFNKEARIKSHPVFIDSSLKLKKDYDIIFSCVDNWGTRFLLNRFALENKIPLINGGVTATGAKLEISKCLECKHDAEGLTKTDDVKSKERSCSYQPTIIQDAFIGALMVAEADALLSKDCPNLLGKELRYFSRNADARKFTIREEKQSCLCSNRKGCMCHEQA